MRVGLLLVALAGTCIAACGEKWSSDTPTVDAGAPDAGNQVAETCYATTRVTVPTADDCTFVGLTDGFCPALNTFTFGNVYRCNDSNGAGRMPGPDVPGGNEGCTRIGPRVTGTTDWSCSPLVCALLDNSEQTCTGNGVAYHCPGDDLSFFNDGGPSSLPVPCFTLRRMTGTLCCEDS